MNDYERIERAIVFIAGRVTEQPSLAKIAAHLHMSPFHFQRLFCRWAGVSPKRFLQVLTLERAPAGGAVAANPIAFAIPCHRVIQQSGALGGFYWGATRKQAMQLWELAQAAAVKPTGERP